MQHGIGCLPSVDTVIKKGTQNLNAMNPKCALSVILVTGMDIDYLNVHVKIAS